MPLFELAACLAVTGVFTAYKCFSYCISSCNDDGGGHQYGRPYSASSTNYGSVTTQPAYRPLPSPTDTRGFYARSKPTIKTPLIPDNNFSRPTRSHIPQRAGPPCLPGVPQYPAVLAARTHRTHRTRRVPADLTPALQSTSSRDPQGHSRPGEREAIRKAPLASLTNLPNLESGEGKNVKGIATAKDLRAQAICKRRDMQKARKLADRAGKEGDHSAREGHNRDALEHECTMKNLNKMAAEIIFREKNVGLSEGTVDLHGLHVAEALDYAKQELHSATLRADKTVRFIVGKGLHSEAGKAKIRPALERLCVKRGYTHFLDPRNAGVLVIQCG